MHINTGDVPIKVNAPGAVARQQTDFGNATGYGKIGAEHFKMDAGTDSAPLLPGPPLGLSHQRGSNCHLHGWRDGRYARRGYVLLATGSYCESQPGY